MRNATRLTVSVFGALAGVSGIVHGIGDIVQGNKAPDGIFILTWPDSPFFDILAGEPAMTIIPNFLITGILAVLFSLSFLIWVTRYVERKNSGLVLILLSAAMLLVGAGFGPFILGVIIGLTATQINSPLNGWRAHVPDGLRRFLGDLWPWAFTAALIAWLMLFPGINMVDYFIGVANADIVYAIAACAFGFLLLTIVTGLARDARKQTDFRRVPAMSV
jgi:hypothetical protein